MSHSGLGILGTLGRWKFPYSCFFLTSTSVSRKAGVEKCPSGAVLLKYTKWEGLQGSVSVQAAELSRKGMRVPFSGNWVCQPASGTRHPSTCWVGGLSDRLIHASSWGLISNIDTVQVEKLRLLAHPSITSTHHPWIPCISSSGSRVFCQKANLDDHQVSCNHMYYSCLPPPCTQTHASQLGL